MRSSRGEADLRQRPENQHPVPAAQHTCYLRGVSLGKISSIPTPENHNQALFGSGYAGLGKREEALQLIQSDYANHRAEFLWTLTDPGLMTLKSDPRYRELLGKLNFPLPPAASR